MAEYIAKPGTGSAFKNENKTEDWHGDYTGQITLPEGAIAGATYYFNVYNNVGKASGKPYLGASIGKQVQPKAGGSAPTESKEDLPF
jgi:hypothetical protein